MKRLHVLYAFLLLFIAAQAVAQVRVQGNVVDEEGKAVQKAKVILASERGGKYDTTTDRSGKWKAIVQVGGTWNIDVEAEGFITSRGLIELSHVQRTPPITTVLKRVPPPEPVEEKPVASTVPPEAVEAVRRGEEFLAAQQFKEAVVEFESAQALLPDHIQIKQALARAYYGAGQVKEALSLLKQVHAADPTNTGVTLLLINLFLEDGNLEEGKALLEKLPEGTLTDPTAVINIGILFMNKEKPKEAFDYFARAVNIDPNRGESYYYRGLALLQLDKQKDAKADFQKVVELSPDSSEAKDAAEMLKQIK